MENLNKNMNNKIENAERKSSSTAATGYTAGNISLYLMDNMDLMKQYEDNYFDLAIVDPPYGIGRDGQKEHINKNPKFNRKGFEYKGWDKKTPLKQYFDELFRVSKNQIIWGGNYFMDKISTNTKGWIVWYKGQNDLTMSDGELAYTSFNVPLRQVTINRVELLKEGTTHPTQKPIKLYEWILDRYAKQGDKILDTHLGSGSIAIACDKMGFSLTACEIDEDYFNGAVKRLKLHQDQYKMEFEAV